MGYDIFTIEVIITIIIVAIQLMFFTETINLKRILSNLFPPKFDKNGKANYTTLTYENKNYGKELNKIGLLKSEENISDHFKRIIKTINHNIDLNPDNYSFKHAKEFCITESESYEDLLSRKAFLPLYIGLMGTFLGVIFGLIVIYHSGINTNTINSFLGGVFIAMFASFVGLVFTTISNSRHLPSALKIYKNNLNDFLNFLETKVILVNSNELDSTLSQFHYQLRDFNREFGDNVNSLKQTLPQMNENIRLQSAFIAEFKKANLPEVGNSILEVYKELRNNKDMFEGFTEYARSLNKSVESSTQLVSDVNSLLNRFTEFEKNIQNVGEIINKNENDFLYIAKNLKETLDMLKQRKEAITEFLSLSESDLNKFFIAQVEAIQKMSQTALINLDNIFKQQTNLSMFDSLNQLSEIKTLLEKNLNKSKDGESAVANEKIIAALDKISLTLYHINKKTRPSIFNTKQFVKALLNKNGNEG